jgi:hypothetical protein
MTADNAASVKLYALTARHGDELGAEDFQALQTIRLTLRGLVQHGFITEFETYSDHDLTTWSFRAGTEDGAEMLAALVDTARMVAPMHWTLST